jgi:hypothetical protein
VISKSANPVSESAPSGATRDPRRAYDRGAWTGADTPPSDVASATDLSGLSTDEIVAELRRREGRLSRLQQKRRRLMAELSELEREIRSVEDSPPVVRAPARGRAAPVRHALARPRNSLSLADAIAAEVEPDETVGPSDVARRVLRNGYQTTAKNFTLLVNGTLRKDTRFERVGRGVYQRLPIGEAQAQAD